MNRFLSRLALLVALVSALVLPASAAFASAPMDVANLGGALSWQTAFDYDEASLVITGPGDFVVERQLTKQDGLTVALDGPLADGPYRWEIKASSAVSEDMKERMAEARAAEDFALASDLRAKSGFTARTFTGTFNVTAGQIGLPETQAIVKGFEDGQGATKDIVHLDDTIITFSLCVGNDCVNGESFGFDTMRLKENNLRIHFDDTSNSASFPSNDWRIVINDSGNGGASYFGIEDSTAGRRPFTVEAGAPVNTLYVEADGDVGIKTSSPVVDLHIVEGNTPTLRLEQDGSDGFQAQTYDVAANEANFFIRDVTNGSALFFRSKPGAPADSLFIAADGDVGIGTDSPDAQIHIKQSDDALLLVENSTATEAQRRLISVVNKGKASIRIADTTVSATNDRWDLAVDSVTSTSEFSISQVGTTVQELKLNTNGDLTILGELVTGMNTYPDYVFDEDYELMPLDQVEAFIAENGHLPGIQSEAEIKAAGGGVNLTELNRRMLEKVEELTLYTLAQEKTIKELTERLEKLESVDSVQ